MSDLLLACLDLRGGHLLPDVLPGMVADAVPVVYLDSDFSVYCGPCASLPDVRPFVTAFDVADPGDFCSVCGRSFSVGVCHG